MKKTAFTFLILCALLALQVKAQEQEVPSLKAHFQGKFEIGAAVNPFQLRGETGVMDSNRKDVEYEDWRGHKLDREMLDLLKRY